MNPPRTSHRFKIQQHCNYLLLFICDTFATRFNPVIVSIMDWINPLRSTWQKFMSFLYYSYPSYSSYSICVFHVAFYLTCSILYILLFFHVSLKSGIMVLGYLALSFSLHYLLCTSSSIHMVIWVHDTGVTLLLHMFPVARWRVHIIFPPIRMLMNIVFFLIIPLYFCKA